MRKKQQSSFAQPMVLMLLSLGLAVKMAPVAAILFGLIILYLILR